MGGGGKEVKESSGKAGVSKRMMGEDMKNGKDGLSRMNEWMKWKDLSTLPP